MRRRVLAARDALSQLGDCLVMPPCLVNFVGQTCNGVPMLTRQLSAPRIPPRVSTLPRIPLN